MLGNTGGDVPAVACYPDMEYSYPEYMITSESPLKITLTFTTVGKFCLTCGQSVDNNLASQQRNKRPNLCIYHIDTLLLTGVCHNLFTVAEFSDVHNRRQLLA